MFCRLGGFLRHASVLTNAFPICTAAEKQILWWAALVWSMWLYKTCHDSIICWVLICQVLNKNSRRKSIVIKYNNKCLWWYMLDTTNAGVLLAVGPLEKRWWCSEVFIAEFILSRYFSSPKQSYFHVFCSIVWRAEQQSTNAHGLQLSDVNVCCLKRNH